MIQILLVIQMNNIIWVILFFRDWPRTDTTIFRSFNRRFDCWQWSRTDLKSQFFSREIFRSNEYLWSVHGLHHFKIQLENFVPSNPTKQMEHSNGPKTSFEPLFSRMCRSRHHNISLKSHSKHFVQTLVKILIFG